eukprot:gene7915-9294_t
MNRYSKHTQQCLLGAVVLLSLIASSFVANADSSLTSDETCPYQPIPSTFDSITYLGFNQEFHFQNTFYNDFKQFTKEINFTLTQQSLFRFYVAPHVVDVDLWLYKNDPGQPKTLIVNSADSTPGGDEDIVHVLDPGAFKLRILFFGATKGTKLPCPTLTIEAAITPVAVLDAREKLTKCPTQSVYPTLNLDMTSQSYIYDSDVNDTAVTFAIVDTLAPGKQNITFLTSYLLNLKQGVINTDKWGVEVTLGFHFMSGGSIGLLIQSADLPDPTTLKCLKPQNCSIGVHTSKGHSVIKTVLAPGEYKLWIYDQTFEKTFTDSLPCTPFSLAIDIQSAHETETILNCDAYTLPPTFNAPGFIDDEGYLYFNDDVFLDLINKNDNVTFTITTTSYIRVYVPSHRVDVDLEITNKTADGSIHTVVAAYTWGGEEEITAMLSPGDYVLNVNFFGNNLDIFCDTFTLEVGIAPQTDYTSVNYCKGVTTSSDAPITSEMIQSALTTDNTFSLNPSNPSAPASPTPLTSPVYSFMFNGQSSQATIANATFTISVESYIMVELDSNFILGDMRAVLVMAPSENNDDPIQYFGDHGRNTHHIYMTLEQGTYTLSILTGLTSKSPTFLPPCILYSLTVLIKPTTKTDPCWGNTLFPTNLMTPGYLGTSTSIHITGEYLVPPLSVYSGKLNSFFNVTKPSVFRAFTQQETIDVDIALYENNNRVVWTSKFDGEESIEYICQPGKSYKMSTSFYHWPTRPSQACYMYMFALSITPSEENPQDTCTPSLPPVNFIGNASLTASNNVGTFHFKQNATTFSQNLPFTVPAGMNALFRAILTFDFVWNDLSLAVKSADGKTVITLGGINYNRVDILPLTLTPGNYILSIYEPFATKTNQLTLKNCVDFTLQTAIQSIDDSQVDQDTIICPSQLFPSTLNSFGYMSTLTANTIYFQQRVLADVSKGQDTIKFTLAAQSVIRVYIPVHPTIDIDVALAFGDGGKTIASSRTVGEEVIYKDQGAGNYVLKFSFYGLSGSPLPLVEDCTDFYVSISISPSDSLPASVTTQCTLPADLPKVIVGNQNFTGTYQRQMGVVQSTQTLGFTITQTGHLWVRLGYNDLAASLAMSLNASVIVNGKQTSKMYYPLYEGGQAHFSEIIQAGTYQLSVYDPFGSQTVPSYVKCATYEFGYMLNTSTPDVPQLCDSTNVLPTDFFTATGGSFPYGGPQATKDGAIRFVHKHFYMSPTSKHNRIQFKVPKKAVMVRMFAEADPNNDIDFFIYSNGSDPKSLVYSSYTGANVETGLVQLQPQANNYTLDVNFLRVNNKQPCNYFHFEFALETVDDLIQDLLCPATMPNEVNQVPPERVEFPYGSDVNLGSNSYLFSSDRIDSNLHNGVFRYRMSLEVQAPISFYAEVGFDFLDNDFNLVLSTHNADGTTSGITTGSDIVPTSDSAFNFVNALQYDLIAGNYFLDILEDMSINSFNLTQACHFFSFHISAQSQVGGLAPRILTVLPPGGYNLSPALPLTLNIRFSEAVAYTSTSVTLLDYINQNHAVQLASNNQIGLRLSPNSAVIKKNDKATLIVTFFPLNASASYNLTIDASKFSNAAGVMFAPENSTFVHVYNMFQCDCSGHGKCVTTSTGDQKCDCNTPWAGITCSKCMVGFHGVGDSCVANTNCTANSCSGNGICSNKDGFPQCTCAVGYTTVDPTALCGACDYGYIGYPKCTNSQVDKGTLCTAPLIPVSLDSVEYLGFNNRMHIQDNYYIDIDTGSAQTTFTLSTPSVIRVYSEPHKVDIDLWLYLLNPDLSINSLISRSLSFGHEESILQTLQPGLYSMVFKYYIWDKRVTIDCETFNLELSIDPVDDLNADLSTWTNKYCKAASTLPNIPYYQNITTATAFTDSSATLYNIPIVAPTSPNVNALYLWNITFTISPSDQSSKVAIIDAALSYQFLPGDLSLVLQSGFGTPKCKGGEQTGITGCVFGDNEMNRNLLHAILQPGDYTLYVYAPFAMYSEQSCALFGFSYQITFANDDEDFFNCDGDILPSSLDSTEFINNNFVHIQDLFLMEKNLNTISFTSLVTPSYIRVSAEQDKSNITISLASQLTPASPIAVGVGSIFTQIPGGNGGYILTIQSDFIASSIHFCPLMNLELIIEPVSFAEPFPPACPANGQDTLPLIQNIRVPYTFEANATSKQVYYTFVRPTYTTTTIAQYTFTITQVSNFYSAVASDFLRGDLRVNLYKKKAGSYLFISGSHDYNYHSIDANLDPDTYVVRIERPSLSYAVTGLPSCIPFEFEFSVVPISASSMCSGERVPLSLNSVRFLGVEGRMHYESSDFMVPNNGSMYLHQDIPLNVPSKSLMRVYIAPHIVDIDIKLIDPATNQVVASGSNRINTEESFIVELAPNFPYVLRLLYWRWGKNIPVCNTFNMEIAIDAETTLQPICPGATNLWPQIPSGIPSSAFYYNSIDSKTPLQFQQSTSQLISHTINFALAVPSNLHAQVGYDFLSGDLALKLVASAAQKTTYGVVRPNRNMLDITNLVPGQYSLTIYEPYSSVSAIMGCSEFNFELFIEPTSAISMEDGFYHILPPTLDTYAFLLYNQHTHLQGEFSMFDQLTVNGVTNAHNKVSFTITVASLFKAQASILPDDETDVYTTVYTPNLVLSGASSDTSVGAMAKVLTPGKYTLEITANAFQSIDSITNVNLELAIEPVEMVNKEITASTLPANCATGTFPQVIIPPTNTYMFNGGQTISDIDINTSGVILTIPFTLTVPSIIYAQLGYQFLLADLDLELTSTTDSTAQVISGKSNRNVNELNVILQPGSYNLVIQNPVALPKISINNPFAQHCTSYHLTFIIRDASENGNHVDCSLFSLTPVDLNSVTGGSVPFGGPIDGSGTLAMYDNSFLIPSKSKQNISLTVKEPTFVQIFTSEINSASIDYSIIDVMHGSYEPVIYNLGTHYNNERSALFLVGNYGEDQTQAPYMLEMSYSGRTKDACPSYAMQILMMPAEDVYSDLACHSDINPPLPNTHVTLDNSGAASEYLNSVFLGEYLAPQLATTTGFKYDVNFTLTQYSRVEAIFSYNSMASNFILSMSQRTFDKNNKVVYNQIAVGDWSSQYTTGATSLTQSLVNPRLRAGNYTLSISHPPLSTAFTSSALYADLCFPFIYSLSIMDARTVYLGDVSPASGFDLPPTKDLSLMFTFSETLYTSASAKLKCSDSNILIGAFALKSTQNAVSIPPSSVVCRSDDATKWTATFKSLYLSSQASYLLSLEPGFLFDDSHINAFLPPHHLYTMIDTTCSNGNGVYTGNECKCNAGYQGAVCDICQVGYMDRSTGNQVICVKNACQVDTCGQICTPSPNAGQPPTCTPLGVCTVNTNGLAVCQCSKAYNGTYCDTCADGYTAQGYPLCQPNFECQGGCGKGTCNHVTGQCQCPSNYEGDHCQSCASGYYGNDCKKNGSTAIVALEVIAGIIAAAIVIGLGVWYVRHRFRAGVARYKMLPKFELDEDEVNGSRFPGLYDDDEDDSNSANRFSINDSNSKPKSKHVFSFRDQPNSVALDSDDDDIPNSADSQPLSKTNMNQFKFDM